MNRSTIFQKLAFLSLLASGAYLILLWSPNILGKHVGYRTKIFIYLLPWMMLWLAYSWQVVADRDHRQEIVLAISIIILGIFNASYSDSPPNSLDPMRTFLLTGIFAFWTSMFLITDSQRRQAFDWLCAGALAVVILVELVVYVTRSDYSPWVFQVFTLHPIPLGTLLILLSPGPVRLILTNKFPASLFGWLLLLGGGLLIYLTHKRGTWLALAAMLALTMIYLARRKKYLLLAMVAAIALIATLQGRSLVARLDPKIPRYVSVLNRLELYNFALHIWKTHPLMGIGLRSFTQNHYLSDYQLCNRDLQNFPQAVTTLQTLDNMLLTALVEMGSLMTLAYLVLITSIIAQYCRRLRSAPEPVPLGWFRLLVLLGFAIHSLSYDSLLFPGVNWLFHMQLGIMAGYPALATGRS
jgi:O-antigen ligase